MPSIHVPAAYAFYKRFILDYSQDKSAIYAQYGFTLQGSIGSKDWEVFAAILGVVQKRPVLGNTFSTK